MCEVKFSDIKKAPQLAAVEPTIGCSQRQPKACDQGMQLSLAASSLCLYIV